MTTFYFSKSMFTTEIDIFQGNFTDIFVTKNKLPDSIDRAQFTKKHVFLIYKNIYGIISIYVFFRPLKDCKTGKLVKLECKEFGKF